MHRYRALSLSLCLCLMLGFLTFGSLHAQDTDLVNLNTANMEQLQELTGIGPTLAKRIVEYREKKPFDSIQEIMEVKGIGQGTFEDIQEHITV